MSESGHALLAGRSLGIVSWETATAWATAGRGLCVLVRLPRLRWVSCRFHDRL